MERLAGQVTQLQASSSGSSRLTLHRVVRPGRVQPRLSTPAPSTLLRATSQQPRGLLQATNDNGKSSVGLAKAKEEASKPQQQLSKNSNNEDDLGLPVGLESESSGSSPLVATLTFFGGLGLLALAGYAFKDQVSSFIQFFIDAVEDWGPLGYLAYGVVYTGLEVLAVPAIPLTMTAGVIFGAVPGTIVVSASGTLAATIAFLIARYAARDKVRTFAAQYPKFKAIDKAIAKDGLKFVTLLRLSPLFPLAVSNYLYGLTSVSVSEYVLGSWIGMLPGTYAYVSAGQVGKAVLMEGEGSLGVETWQVGVALGVTLLVLGYVGQLAKRAIEEEGSDNAGDN